MDRRETHPSQFKNNESPARDTLLPSRQAALGRLRTAVEQASGPVLLTGEAGSGKTWLVRQWVRKTTTPAFHWVSVDVPPVAGSIDLLRAIASALGLTVKETTSASTLRIALTRLLSEQTQDERRWGLVIDEAHLATPSVLEELRVLSNRLRQADGFWSIVLVGQTELARQLSSWPLRALEARLSARIHLGPIDADEARLLLGPAVSTQDAERRHRDACGNPGRLLRIDPPSRIPSPWTTTRLARLVSEDAHVAPDSTPPAPAPAPILPSRPPLSVEDGVIEVGWDSETDDEPSISEETPEPAHSLSASASASASEAPRQAIRPQTSSPLGVEVPVHDPYAALQAWNEWTANQDRSDDPESSEPPDSDDELYPPLPRPRTPEDEEFTPYQQLFSRLSEANKGE